MKNLLELAKEKGLTRDQLYRMKKNLIAKHGEDDWLIGKCSNQGRMQILVNEQGQRWIETVYLNPEQTMEKSEIEFQLTEISMVENLLAVKGIKYTPGYKRYTQMTPGEMMEEFGVGKTSMYGAIKKLSAEYPEEIKRSVPMIVSGKGIQWIEENIFISKYIKDLNAYRRSLEILAE